MRNRERCVHIYKTLVIKTEVTDRQLWEIRVIIGRTIRISTIDSTESPITVKRRQELLDVAFLFIHLIQEGTAFQPLQLFTFEKGREVVASPGQDLLECCVLPLRWLFEALGQEIRGQKRTV